MNLLASLTPYITLLLTALVGAIVYLIRDKLCHLERRVIDLEVDVRKVASEHNQDQRMILRDYVQKEEFYMAVGKMEGLVKEIFHDLREITQQLNRTIGANEVRRKKDE